MVKLESLKKSSQFINVLKEKKTHTEYFSIFAAKNTISKKNKLLISFVVKKKIGNAVKRNRIRRKFKAIVNKLLKILHTLVDEGNTVIVIEHNLDVIKTADHIIDMGPEGGQKGGQIIFEGTPENIVKNKKSYTGLYLKKILDNNK